MKLYLWHMDCGWRGFIVAIASTEKEARSMMENEYNYQQEKRVEKHEIKQGLVLVGLGDC